MIENITEKKNRDMMSGTHLMLRTSIVLGMVAAVVTIIYFTPYPGKNIFSNLVSMNLKTFMMENMVTWLLITHCGCNHFLLLCTPQ